MLRAPRKTDHDRPRPPLACAKVRSVVRNTHNFSSVDANGWLGASSARTLADHSWHVPLYVSASGLTTSLINTGMSPFKIDFDLLNNKLVLRRTDHVHVKL